MHVSMDVHSKHKLPYVSWDHISYEYRYLRMTLLLSWSRILDQVVTSIIDSTAVHEEVRERCLKFSVVHDFYVVTVLSPTPQESLGEIRILPIVGSPSVRVLYASLILSKSRLQQMLWRTA